MATRQPGMTASTAAQIPSTREVVAQEVSRALSELADHEERGDDEIEMTSADRVSEMLQSDLGERAYVRVYKMDERSGQHEFCKDYSPQEFETNGNELIRTEWGYGKFRVVLYGNVPGTKRFTIRAKNDLSFAKPLTPTAVAVAPTQNTGIDRLAEIIAQGQQAILQALTQRPPERDPMAEMTQMLTLMTTMREAMGLNNQPPQKTPVAEIVDAIKELKSASELIGGEKEKDDPTTQMLAIGSEVIGMIKGGMNGAQVPQAAQSAQPFPQLSVPASLGAPAENPIQPTNQIPIDPEDEEMLEQLLFVKKLKTSFIPLAGDETKIEDAAIFLADKTPESLDGLLSMMEQPTWFELLEAAAPQYLPALVPVVGAHREWLTKVRDRLLELLKEED